MTPLERRCRSLLRAYPARYRQRRAEEMVATLLETTPSGRTWPLPRDSMALLLGGLRARAGQDQRFSTRASLRVAALLGCAVYLSFTAVNYASYGLVPVGHGAGLYGHGVGLWRPPLIVAPVILVAALLPWFTSRTVVALGAALAGTATVAFTLLTRPVLMHVATSPVRQILEVLAPLAALVLLSSGRQRPPRLWLWLPGLVMALAIPPEIASLTHQSDWYGPGPDPYLWLVPLAVVFAWFAIDARPAVALAVYSGLWFSQALVNYSQFHDWSIYLVSETDWGTNPWSASLWAGSRAWIAAVPALAVLALWRVRRQAAL